MKRKLIDGAKFEVVVRSRRGTNEILTESVIDLRTEIAGSRCRLLIPIRLKFQRQDFIE